LIGKYLHDNDRHVVLLDNNGDNVKKTRELGIDAIEGSVYADDLMNNIELNDIGYLMAMTGNSDINKTAISKFKKRFGENGSFRVITSDEMNNPEKNPTEGLFSHTDDYIKLSEVSRKYPKIHELTLNSKKHYEGLIEISKTDTDIIPLFVKNKKGGLTIIPSHSADVEIEEEFQLVYLGKKVQREEKAEEDYDETIDEEGAKEEIEKKKEQQEQGKN
jgi:hypothetical protein